MSDKANPKTREDDRRGAEAGAFGQQPFEVRDGEREKVAEYARFLTARQIGLLLRGLAEPVSKDTIARHFQAELEWGRANMLHQAGGKLIDNVIGGDPGSIKFYLMTHGDPGQFVERRELTGRGGGPIQTVDLAAAMEKLAGLNDEELPDLERLASILARIVGDGAGGPATAPDAAGPDSSGDSAPGA